MRVKMGVEGGVHGRGEGECEGGGQGESEVGEAANDAALE